MELTEVHKKLIEKIKNTKIKSSGIPKDLDYKEKLAIRELIDNNIIIKNKIGRYWVINDKNL